MDLVFCNLEGWPGIHDPKVKDWLVEHQITADAWYVANPNLTVAETRRLERVGKAVDEFLDRIALAPDGSDLWKTILRQHAPTLDLHEIQATILRPRPAPYFGTHVLLRVDDAQAGRAFLRRLTPHIDSADGLVERGESLACGRDQLCRP